MAESTPTILIIDNDEGLVAAAREASEREAEIVRGIGAPAA